MRSSVPAPWVTASARGRSGLLIGALCVIFIVYYGRSLPIQAMNPEPRARKALMRPNIGTSQASSSIVAEDVVRHVAANDAQEVAAASLALPASPPPVAPAPAASSSPPPSAASVSWGSAASSQCTAAFALLTTSAPASVWPPACPLPADSPLRAGYEGPSGTMPITRDYCFAQRYEGELIVDWSAAYIDGYCAGMAAGTTAGTYGPKDDALAALALAAVPGGLRDTMGVILGSELPWLECLALAAGAADVWTMEYATIRSTHPRLHARLPKVMAADFASGELPQADWVATFSSLEHSGLGRYGDAPNPDGDKEALAQAWCMLKPGGYLVLGLPMTCSAQGFIWFNAHRKYGFVRLAYIAEGYELVGYPTSEVGETTVVILRKPVAAGVSPLTADDFAAAHAKLVWKPETCAPPKF